MPYNPDISVYTPDGERRLLVEVKARSGPDEDDWARQFRRNILSHFPREDDAYFLLVLPRTLHLWAPESGMDAAPDYTASTKEALGPYYEKAGAHELGERALELVVKSWLSYLVSFESPDGRLDENHQWLRDSGLYEAIRGGRVEGEVAV